MSLDLGLSDIVTGVDTPLDAYPVLQQAITEGQEITIPLERDLAAELEAWARTATGNMSIVRPLRAQCAVVAYFAEKLIKDEDGQVDLDDLQFQAMSFAKTVLGLDLYLGFALEQQRSEWMYSDGNQEIDEVLALLREAEEGQTWDAEGEDEDEDEGGGANEDEDEDADDDGDAPKRKVTLPEELLTVTHFESFMDMYDEGIKVPVKANDYESVYNFCLVYMDMNDEVTPKTLAAGLVGVLKLALLRKSNTLWEGNDVDTVIGSVEECIKAAHEMVLKWMDADEDKFETKSLPEGWEATEPEEADEEVTEVNGMIITITRNNPQTEEVLFSKFANNDFATVLPVEEAATLIWVQLCTMVNKYRKAKRERDEAEANMPGNKWAAANGKLRFDLPDSLGLKTEAVAEQLELYPCILAAINQGFYEFPLSQEEYAVEGYAPLALIYSEDTEALSPRERAPYHYFAMMRAVAGDPESEWWSSSPSDEEVRGLPTAMAAAYETVKAELEGIPKDTELAGRRPYKTGPLCWVNKLWNLIVENLGGSVPTYSGDDLLINVPEVILQHSSVASKLDRPAIAAVIKDGAIVAPFTDDFVKAIKPTLSAITTDPKEPRNTRLAAIMVIHWLEDFVDDCWYTWPQDGDVAGAMKVNYVPAFERITKWATNAPANAIPRPKGKDFCGMEDPNRLWSIMWDDLVETEGKMRVQGIKTTRRSLPTEVAECSWTEWHLSSYNGSLSVPYYQKNADTVMELAKDATEDKDLPRATRILAAGEYVLASDYLTMRNKLFQTVDVEKTVKQFSSVISGACALVSKWADDLGDEPMSTKDVPAVEDPGKDEDGHRYVLHVAYPVPEVETAATRIWNVLANGEAKIAEVAEAKAEEDAAKPGTVFLKEHGTVQIPIPPLLKEQDLSQWPNLVEGADKGYLEAPVSEALFNELWDVGNELRPDSRDVTNVVTALGRYLRLILGAFGDEMWNKSREEVENLAAEFSAAFDAVAAELEAVDADAKLEPKEDSEGALGLEPWTKELWNDTLMVLEMVLEEKEAAQEEENEAEDRKFDITLPDLVFEHPAVEFSERVLQAPIAEDSEARTVLDGQLDTILEDLQQPRLMRLAAVYAQAQLEVFSADWSHNWDKGDGDVSREFRDVLEQGYQLARKWLTRVDDSKEEIKLRELPYQGHEETEETAASKLWDQLVIAEMMVKEDKTKA